MKSASFVLPIVLLALGASILVLGLRRIKGNGIEPVPPDAPELLSINTPNTPAAILTGYIRWLDQNSAVAMVSCDIPKAKGVKYIDSENLIPADTIMNNLRCDLVDIGDRVVGQGVMTLETTGAIDRGPWARVSVDCGPVDVDTADCRIEVSKP